MGVKRTACVLVCLNRKQDTKAFSIVEIRFVTLLFQCCSCIRSDYEETTSLETAGNSLTFSMTKNTASRTNLLSLKEGEDKKNHVISSLFACIFSQ